MDCGFACSVRREPEGRRERKVGQFDVAGDLVCYGVLSLPPDNYDARLHLRFGAAIIWICYCGDRRRKLGQIAPEQKSR